MAVSAGATFAFDMSISNANTLASHEYAPRTLAVVDETVKFP